jgi:ferritin-like protein
MTVRTRGSTEEALDRLIRCPAQEMGTALWWATLAHHLGELCEELTLTDVGGLAAQITTDAPHFAAAARRLPEIEAQAQRDVARLRRVAADRCGSATAVVEVRGDVDALLRRVRNLTRLSNTLMLDAYERDIGGD